MEKINYNEFITNYLTGQHFGVPIYSETVAQVLAGEFNLPLPGAKTVTNMALKRAADNGTIERFTKGIYYKTKETPFGKKKLNENAVAVDVLTRDGDNLVGYETGPSLYNKVGLTTQIPKCYYIATNLYTKRLTFGKNVVARKPVTEVNPDNIRYLQTLDIIAELDKTPVDAEFPATIIRGFAEKNDCKPERAVVIARQFYPVQVLQTAVDIFLGGIQV